MHALKKSRIFLTLYYNTVGELTWDVLRLIENVAVTKSRHCLFFYPTKERVKRTEKDLFKMFLSKGVDYGKGRC